MSKIRVVMLPFGFKIWVSLFFGSVICTVTLLVPEILHYLFGSQIWEKQDNRDKRSLRTKPKIK